MDTHDDDQMKTHLQQVDVNERRARREYELMLAAEAHHRLQLLNGSRPRLEDLAEEWIELLRASSGKPAG